MRPRMGSCRAFLLALDAKQFFAPPELDGGVHLSPELAEVLDGGGDAEDDDAPHPDHREPAESFPADADQDHRYGDHLRDHFGFSKIAGFDGVALGGGDAAEAGNGELASYNQDDHPSRHPVNLD